MEHPASSDTDQDPNMPQANSPVSDSKLEKRVCTSHLQLINLFHANAQTHIVSVDVRVIPLQAIVQYCDDYTLACNPFLPHRNNMEI